MVINIKCSCCSGSYNDNEVNNYGNSNICLSCEEMLEEALEC